MSTHVNLPMEDPPWKKLKLSLERPYKDDNGAPIPVLLDITPDGQQIYEPRDDPTSKIGDDLRRIFVERGHDFFDTGARGADTEKDDADEEKEQDARDNLQPMTPEELLKMRMDIVPQLHIALGEMTQARDLLARLLDKPNQSSFGGLLQTMQPTAAIPDELKLRATVATKPPPIQSVQAFNTELVVGGKDKALRKAADLLKSASESVEQSRIRSERYWVDALKIRRGNWGLIPAPLPLGSATGKGADKTSKDFLVSFGLEESPAAFRRRAIGRIPTFDAHAGTLEYPLRQFTRLQISIIVEGADGTRRVSRNQYRVADDASLEGSLRAAQAEVVQQEIFSALIKEASNLSTASARVSERLIALEAAQGTELRFELVDNDAESSTEASDPTCDLIFATLHVLLLRAHTHLKMHRLGHAGVVRGAVPPPTVEAPPLLQPIVDLLQYRVFCGRVHHEVRKVVDGLRAAGVQTKLWLNPVGESGEKAVAMLSQPDAPQKIGGEASIRIDDRRTLRLTYLSPSSLIAHLPQATLTIGSISQLSQLLFDEVGSCLLECICEVAGELCESVHGTWFVDLLTNRTIGRWEGRALNFHVSFAQDSSVVCTATSLEKGDRHPVTHSETYTAKVNAELSLLDWVRQTVNKALEHSA